MSASDSVQTGRPLTNRDYWDASDYAALRLSDTQQSEFQPLFDRLVPPGDGREALEIGACPGVHLAALARSHGYAPVALDILPRVHELRDAFANAGFPPVETIEADFLAWETERRFAVVMSLGFIEHFNDPEPVIRRHWELVDEGGVMVLGVPLFGPWQLWLRRRIMPADMLERVLAVHNTRVMSVSFLSDFCSALRGAHVRFGGPIWQMHTWFGLREPFVRPTGRMILAAWKLLARIPRRLDWSSEAFSPYALVVVERGACV